MKLKTFDKPWPVQRAALARPPQYPRFLVPICSLDTLPTYEVKRSESPPVSLALVSGLFFSWPWARSKTGQSLSVKRKDTWQPAFIRTCKIRCLHSRNSTLSASPPRPIMIWTRHTPKWCIRADHHDRILEHDTHEEEQSHPEERNTLGQHRYDSTMCA